MDFLQQTPIPCSWQQATAIRTCGQPFGNKANKAKCGCPCHDPIGDANGNKVRLTNRQSIWDRDL